MKIESISSVKEEEMKKKTVYKYDDFYSSTLEYFKGDELAAKVWINKYAIKDSFGNIYELNPDHMHQRLAKEIHRIEIKYANPLSYEEIYESIKEFKYIIPQGGPMTGIGNEYQVVSLSNCFVIGENGSADSYGAILKIDEEQVQLMKRRGGVGHDLSHIRPKGSPVKNSALTSTGVVPFMERYSNSTREVAQDGRRGALMLTYNIEGIDSEDFIDAKLEQGKVTGANISIKITDSFMQSVISGEKFMQKWPIDSDNPVYTKEIDAQKLWKKIVYNAWKSAEPGILFWDTILKESLADCYAEDGFKTIGTNPCAELALSANESCRLISINLYSFVNDPFTENATFDFNRFEKYIWLTSKIMDDFIDLELEKIDMILSKIDSDPESESIKNRERELWKRIRYAAEIGRRTGIGVTGEGDMFAALNMRYGSDESVEFAEKVHKALAAEVYTNSIKLAKERGCFKIWNSEKEKDNPFLKRVLSEISKKKPEVIEDYYKYGRRHIACLTIAPTGCVDKNTIIKTDTGNLTMLEIFLANGIDINMLSGLKNIWIDVIDDIFVFNIEGKRNKITRLYWNGLSTNKKIKFNDGKEIITSLEHKVLVKINDDTAIWKEIKDLRVGDKIIKINYSTW